MPHTTSAGPTRRELARSALTPPGESLVVKGKPGLAILAAVTQARRPETISRSSGPLPSRYLAALAVAVVAVVSVAAFCGSAAATQPMLLKTNSCPPGYQIDPQNSQQCQSLSPAGPETSTAGCQTAGYANDPHGSSYCLNSAGQDTQGNYR